MDNESRDQPDKLAGSSPRLTGRGILLRRATDDDVLPLWEAAVASKAELIPWLPWCHEHYSLEETAQWLALCREGWDSRESFYFVVTDEVSGSIIGACGLHRVDWPNRRADLGYWVRSGAQGSGVATEAARLLARYGLEELGLARLEIIVECGNAASERVAGKVGAKREGVLRHRLWLRECSHDAVSYSLTVEDLPRLQQ